MAVDILPVDNQNFNLIPYGQIGQIAEFGTGNHSIGFETNIENDIPFGDPGYHRFDHLVALNGGEADIVQ